MFLRAAVVAVRSVTGMGSVQGLMGLADYCSSPHCSRALNVALCIFSGQELPLCRSTGLFHIIMWILIWSRFLMINKSFKFKVPRLYSTRQYWSPAGCQDSAQHWHWLPGDSIRIIPPDHSHPTDSKSLAQAPVVTCASDWLAINHGFPRPPSGVSLIC